MLAKRCLISFIATFFIFIATNVFAANTWILGTIKQVAVNDASVAWIIFTSSDSTVNNVVFILSSSNTNALLATALTAQSSGKNVYIYVPSTAKNSVCSAIAMQN